MSKSTIFSSILKNPIQLFTEIIYFHIVIQVCSSFLASAFGGDVPLLEVRMARVVQQPALWGPGRRAGPCGLPESWEAAAATGPGKMLPAPERVGGQRPALASATLLRPQEAPSGPESVFPCQETRRWGRGLLTSSTVCQGISNEGILCVWNGKASPCNSTYADHVVVWNQVNARVPFQV